MKVVCFTLNRVAHRIDMDDVEEGERPFIMSLASKKEITRVLARVDSRLRFTPTNLRGALGFYLYLDKDG